MNALALGTALWLGVLTSISPCPMATNVAAISFLGRRVTQPRLVLLSGALYCAGRVAAYVLIGAGIVAGVMSVPGAAGFLQRYLTTLLGPVLIVVGMVLLELVPLPSFGAAAGAAMQRRAEKGGATGAALLGFVFALAFCPVSAALFFGSLVPLSLKHQSALILPTIYGLGTGLPVAAFAVLVAIGAGSVASVFNRLTSFELWARRATGVVFILVGVYETLRTIFGVAI